MRMWGGNPIYYYDPYGLWSIGDPVPQWVVDGSAGLGDGIISGLSFGFLSGQEFRNNLGINGVNTCSSLYGAANITGQLIGGMSALGGAGKGAVNVLDHLTGGYGFSFGKNQFMYQMPSMVSGRTIAQIGKFRIQFEKNWGNNERPFYQWLYFKLPGKTNNHWPWQGGGLFSKGLLGTIAGAGLYSTADAIVDIPEINPRDCECNQ